MALQGKRNHLTGVGRVHEQAVATVGFDWLMVVLSAWFQAGAYLDGWAHLHVPGLETFFTPWHAVFYSGFFVVAVAILGIVAKNYLAGYPWHLAVPAGYELSVLGVLIFAVAGVADMLWHIIFGIEVSVEALLSPTHLMLALGAALIVSGPLRSVWHRTEIPAKNWREVLPAVISLAYLLSVFTFMTQFAHPWANPFAAESNRPTSDDLIFYRQALGVASILLQAGLLMGLVLYTVRRYAVPLLGFTLVLGINALLMGLMRDQLRFLPMAIVAGLVADVLMQTLRPSVERRLQLRIFSFVVPAVLFALYFLTLALTGGIWWSIHMWAGAIVLAGISGWLLSYLVVP